MNNVTFENPYILASSPITRNAEMISRAFEKGWAGAVLKTITLKHETMIDTHPRLFAQKQGSKVLSLNNIELISRRPLEVWLKEIEELKKNFPTKIIIASIMDQADNLENWVYLAKAVEQAGSDIIELNLSCPNGISERQMGSYFSQNPDLSAEIIKVVKKNTNIPVWSKIAPDVGNISALAQKCLNAKSDAIVALNTFKGFSGIDIETLTPKLNIDGFSTYGGFSGSAVKPFVLKAISEIYDKTGCAVCATGGIINAKDAIEYILLGANTVQICTEVMLRGYGIIDHLIYDLENYMERKGFNSVNEMVGLATKTIIKSDSLNKSKNCVAFINQEKCTNCQNCYTSCADGAYQAIEKLENFCKVITEKCDSCGLCHMVCPQSAISYVQL